MTIHAMTDVTNGGIRGDAKEISYTAKVKLLFEEESMRRLVNPRVLEMLDDLQIDYLGVSIDALLIIAPQEEAERSPGPFAEPGWRWMRSALSRRERAHCCIWMAKCTDFSPRFRESAYTPIKKAVGQDARRDVAEMTAKVDRAAMNAVEKKRQFIEKIKRK